MILGCMQPYLFPYVGYFDLINRCDTWVVFDTVGYHRRQWMNRNRVLRPDWGWQYVTAPVAGETAKGPIADVRLQDKEAARRRIEGQLGHYRDKRAPFFAAAIGLVEQSFELTESDRLADLAVNGLRVVSDYLGIAFAPIRLSEAGLQLPPIHASGDWALEISAAMGASDYLNAPGGRPIFDPAAFAARGIRLHFADLIDFSYRCGDRPSLEHLSILDVLMWNPPTGVKTRLDEIKSRWLHAKFA